MTVTDELGCSGSRDPLAFWRITGFCNPKVRARDPQNRDPGYQGSSESIFIGQQLSLYFKILY